MSGKILFSVLVILSIQFPTKSNSLIFDSESVFVDIRLPDTVSVYGIYFFANQSSELLDQPIYYPFPVDSQMMYPHEIKVFRDKEKTEIPFTKTPQGILFPVKIDKKSSIAYRITYTHKVKGGNGCYILTTTQNWNRPLRSSVLSVSIPSKQVLRYVSYDADTVFVSGEKLKYGFSFRDFMPVKDLIFSW